MFSRRGFLSIVYSSVAFGLALIQTVKSDCYIPVSCNNAPSWLSTTSTCTSIGSAGGDAEISSLQKRVDNLWTQFRQLNASFSYKSAFQENVTRTGSTCFMGMKSGSIPNSAITASSEYDSRHAAWRGRLDNTEKKSTTTIIDTGSWSSKGLQVGEYLQVDFGAPKTVVGIITQGRPAAINNQWVKLYKIKYGPSISNMSTIQEAGQDKVFNGNTDINSKVYNSFPSALKCRYIRVYPQDWNNHISMRVEFVGQTPDIPSCFND